MPRSIECFVYSKSFTIRRKDDSRLTKRLDGQIKKCEASGGCPSNCAVREYRSSLDKDEGQSKQKSDQRRVVYVSEEEMDTLDQRLPPGSRLVENCMNCAKVEEVEVGSLQVEPRGRRVMVHKKFPRYRRLCSAGGEMRVLNVDCEAKGEFVPRGDIPNSLYED